MDLTFVQATFIVCITQTFATNNESTFPNLYFVFSSMLGDKLAVKRYDKNTCKYTYQTLTTDVRPGCTNLSICQLETLFLAC